MNSLFVALYLDEDVNVHVGELLMMRGFRVVTTRDAGQLGQSDSAQLAYATSKSMSILTHNRADFEGLNNHYIETGQAHAGIVIATRRRPYELTQRLLRLLNTLTADEMQNQLIYI